MVERVGRHDSGEVMGRTRTHKTVNFASATARPGNLVQVELLQATSTSLRAREVEEIGGAG
jgi:tRNA A37 methylthiotransferase MiaB